MFRFMKSVFVLFCVLFARGAYGNASESLIVTYHSELPSDHPLCINYQLENKEKMIDSYTYKGRKGSQSNQETHEINPHKTPFDYPLTLRVTATFCDANDDKKTDPQVLLVTTFPNAPEKNTIEVVVMGGMTLVFVGDGETLYAQATNNLHQKINAKTGLESVAW